LAPPPIVYKRHYLRRGDEINPEDSSIDLVTELVFPNRVEFLAWSAPVGTGVGGDQVAADELRFSIGRGPGPMSSRNT
jgi:hypothetical protein